MFFYYPALYRKMCSVHRAHKNSLAYVRLLFNVTFITFQWVTDSENLGRKAPRGVSEIHGRKKHSFSTFQWFSEILARPIKLKKSSS